MRFTVLASGSGGNASLVEVNGFGVLLDIGLGPRQLAARLAAAGRSWQDVHAVLLTHTHGDHWRDATLKHLLRRRIPLYCHESHPPYVEAWSEHLALLREAGLLRCYVPGVTEELAPGLRFRPLLVRHDSDQTFGFRLDGSADLLGHTPSLGYLADLGCWDEALVEAVADVDLLALEFNHDVDLEWRSGRHPRLIHRVLGDEGHLSNEQAAQLLAAVLGRSTPERLRSVVQLHLSRECNHTRLAADAASRVLREHGSTAKIHTASQDEPLPTLHLGAIGATNAPRSRMKRVRRTESALQAAQPWLPGFEP